MTLFRKKPVEIEARRYTTPGDSSILAWCGGRAGYAAKPSDPSDIAYWIDIPTLEGTMRANLGDWIIRGVRGEFYPCKPDIFAATYEAVDVHYDELVRTAAPTKPTTKETTT